MMNYRINENTKNKIYKIAKYTAILIVILLVVFNIYTLIHMHKEKQQVDIKLPKQEFTIKGFGETKTETKTEIVYVPKETIKYYTIDKNTGETIENMYTEKTDIEANIGKPSVNVKLNDKDIEINKADDEKYVFEKNKLKLTQSSKVDFDIHVDPIEIDKTKHWGIGGGYNSKNGATVIAEFPINKKGNIDGWVTKDSETVAAGIIVKF